MGGGEGQVLTELTLQAELLPDLVDPHHGGIPDFLQDIWQDFGVFWPTIEKSMNTQKTKQNSTRLGSPAHCFK